MIKWGSLLAVLALLVGYAFFGIYQPEQVAQKERVQELLFAPEELLTLDQLNLTTGEGTIELRKKQGQWWVEKPQTYLADQEFIEKSLKIMEGTLASSWFEFKEDRFGLKPGKALFQMIFEDQRQRRLVVGEQEGPANSIYVLDMDANRVFVLHNVWAQLLYYPESHFFHKFLPIPGKLVKNVALFGGDKQEWGLKPAKSGKMKATLGNQTLETDRAPWLWFFSKLREFPLKNLQFGQPPKAFLGPIMKIETNLGNIRFVFSKKGDQVSVPSLNVFAEVDPHSLRSLSKELEKVMSRDKK